MGNEADLAVWRRQQISAVTLCRPASSTVTRRMRKLQANSVSITTVCLGNEKLENGQSLHTDEAGSANSKTEFQSGHQETFRHACTQNTLTLENTNYKPSKAYTYQHTAVLHHVLQCLLITTPKLVTQHVFSTLDFNYILTQLLAPENVTAFMHRESFKCTI